MPTEHIVTKELTGAVTAMLANDEYDEFAPLRDNEVKIEACLCVRTNQDGDNMPPKAEPVALKKVSPVEKLFLQVDYILIVDNSAWTTANSDTAQLAIIHRGLMKIDVESGEKGLKLATRKPDFVEFSTTLRRFGAYKDQLLNLREIFSPAAKRFADKHHG